MRYSPLLLSAVWIGLFQCGIVSADVPSAKEAALPPAVERPVDFTKEIKPLLEASCLQCHGRGKAKGGFSLETRDAFLKGGDNGPAAIIGKSGESSVIGLVAGIDPDNVMPQKGTRWTPEQVGLLRGWIDQGMSWDASVTFARPRPINLEPRSVDLPEGGDAHPIDRLVDRYFASMGLATPAIVDDALFCRRVYLDVIGLLPTPRQLDEFSTDPSPDKRLALVSRLLADNYGYADHWLTFWNDLLRNDYKGTGYIDGGRKQITGWLYSALLDNMPYDQFVRDLVNPTPASEGFAKGIVWRGSANASMTPPMQAAQNVAQVFFGVNLKCASCHDSFVSDWTLSDAYSLAAVFSDQPLELVHCDKPTGQSVSARFLYSQIGQIDGKLAKPERLKKFAELMTSQKNGRLSRTIVNRLWARLLGRGLVETLDDMEKPAWDADLLDWLSQDLVDHHYDLKHTIEVILTSRAYQYASVGPAAPADKGPAQPYTFQGPTIRRMTAEQFCDALSSITGDWGMLPSSPDFDFSGGKPIPGLTAPRWVWTAEPLEPGVLRMRWQVAQAKTEEAQKLAVEVQKLAAENSPKAKEVATTARLASIEAARLTELAEAAILDPHAAAYPEYHPAKPAPKTDPKAKGPSKGSAPAKTDGSVMPKGDQKPEAAKPEAGKPEAGKVEGGNPEERKAEAGKAAPSVAKVGPTGRAAAKDSVAAGAPEPLPLVRHRVVFRKKFALDAVPDEAFAAAAASQKFDIQVNGKAAAGAANDRSTNGRTQLYDLKSLLQKGENVIVLSVDSHTEKPALREDDLELRPELFDQINPSSGAAFYLRCKTGEHTVEVVTDDSWHVRRAPEIGSNLATFDDKAWPAATLLPDQAAAIDQGPALVAGGKVGKGLKPVDLGKRLPSLLSITVRAGKIRAALLNSDSLEAALERPNREQVMSARAAAASTLQALELTNGAALDARLKRGSGKIAAIATKAPEQWVTDLYEHALARKPTEAERAIAAEILGSPVKPESAADLLWVVAMLPEFQFIR